MALPIAKLKPLGPSALSAQYEIYPKLASQPESPLKPAKPIYVLKSKIFRVIIKISLIKTPTEN